MGKLPFHIGTDCIPLRKLKATYWNFFKSIVRHLESRLLILLHKHEKLNTLNAFSLVFSYINQSFLLGVEKCGGSVELSLAFITLLTFTMLAYLLGQKAQSWSTTRAGIMNRS